MACAFKQKLQVIVLRSMYINLWNINHLHWAEGKNLSVGP